MVRNLVFGLTQKRGCAPPHFMASQVSVVDYDLWIRRSILDGARADPQIGTKQNSMRD